jgi:hypothetical protein
MISKFKYLSCNPNLKQTNFFASDTQLHSFTFKKDIRQTSHIHPTMENYESTNSLLHETIITLANDEHALELEIIASF